MPTFTAKVSNDLAIPIPKEMVEKLLIEPGEEVEFFLTSEGQIHFHVLREGFGEYVSVRHVPLISIREIDDGIAEHLIEKNDRILAQGREVRKPAAE